MHHMTVVVTLYADEYPKKIGVNSKIILSNLFDFESLIFNLNQVFLTEVAAIPVEPSFCIRISAYLPALCCRRAH